MATKLERKLQNELVKLNALAECMLDRALSGDYESLLRGVATARNYLAEIDNLRSQLEDPYRVNNE